MKLTKLFLLGSLMLGLTIASAQSVTSISAVEKQVKDKWVAQYYIVVLPSGTNNATVLFDSKQKVITSAVGTNIRIGLPETSQGKYRVTKLQ